MAERFWLNEWAAIEPLPPKLAGKPRVDDRRVISGILHRFREGLRGRAVPVEYGPRTPPPFNRVAYRMRNRIERASCGLKDWRAIATRDDQTARNVLAGVRLAVVITDWIS